MAQGSEYPTDDLYNLDVAKLDNYIEKLVLCSSDYINLLLGDQVFLSPICDPAGSTAEHSSVGLLIRRPVYYNPTVQEYDQLFGSLVEAGLVFDFATWLHFYNYQ